MWPFTKSNEDDENVVATGGVLGGGKPRPFQLPVKDDPRTHETAADRLNWLCKKYNGTYQIVRNPGQSVIVRILLDNGNAMVNGAGPTTRDAVIDLLKKEQLIADCAGGKK